MNKVGNRSRRLAAKVKALLGSVKEREQQIAAVQANDELDAEQKASLVTRLRAFVGNVHAQANRLDARRKELAYEDRSPNAAVRSQTPGFISHTEILLERDTKWTRLNRRECKCGRAFYAVQEAYAAR